ncbi:MAG: HlyD family secretion protein [Pseudomonadota bacterium]
MEQSKNPDNQPADAKAETPDGNGPGPEEAAKSEKSKSGDLTGLRKVTLIALALAVVIFAYYVIADRTTPFAGDARVQAFVLRVAPELNGRVERVGVADNQPVEEGAELLRLDQVPFKLAVDQAQANLEQAGQGVGASTAEVELAQARLDEARASAANVQVQSERVLELVRRGVYAKAREDDAIAAIDAAKAVVESAEADLRRAKEALGPQGQDNPQIQAALSSLEQARYDLARTTLVAPSRGVVTNLQLTGGQTVVAGQQVMTFISAEDVWLLASFRENSLGVLAEDQRAEVVLDTLPGQIFEAEVRSIGWGVADSDVDPATGLPKTSTEDGWLTDPLRFPVQLTFDKDRLPKGARYGSRAAVIVYASDNTIMDAIAWLRIRIIAILTYVS